MEMRESLIRAGEVALSLQDLAAVPGLALQDANLLDLIAAAIQRAVDLSLSAGTTLSAVAQAGAPSARQAGQAQPL